LCVADWVTDEAGNEAGKDFLLGNPQWFPFVLPGYVWVIPNTCLVKQKVKVGQKWLIQQKFVRVFNACIAEIHDCISFIRTASAAEALVNTHPLYLIIA